MLLETIESEQSTPSLAQAQRMKKMSQSGELNIDSILSIMIEPKKQDKITITLDESKLRRFFPRSYTPEKIEEIILRLLESWHKKKMKERQNQR